MSTTFYHPNTKTAAEWREMATASRKRSTDSFDRCDTDGYLSQWAHDTQARLYARCARVAEAGGVATFRMLADLDGNLLDAKLVAGKYGQSWRVWDEASRTVRWFTESEARKASTRVASNARKGYKFVAVEAEAVVYMDGHGYSVHPVVAPRKGAPLTILGDMVENDR